MYLPTLLDFINKLNIPVIWTLFDCWAFTGHCSYFDVVGSVKWKNHCFSCPIHNNYPSSWVDNSFSFF